MITQGSVMRTMAEANASPRRTWSCRRRHRLIRIRLKTTASLASEAAPQNRRDSLGRNHGVRLLTISAQPTIAQLLDEHVTLTLHSLDRIYLNGYVPRWQTMGGVDRYSLRERKKAIASPGCSGK